MVENWSLGMRFEGLWFGDEGQGRVEVGGGYSKE